MKTLREHISEAVTSRKAIGHFNICTMDGVWAVVDAAKELKVPVIIGVSEGERDYVGLNEIAAVVRTIREERGQEVFLNADHTYSFERVKEAIDAGYDSVIFDGAKLSLEENIKITKQCVEYAKEHAARSRELGTTPSSTAIPSSLPIIEGELGFIGTSSKVLDDIPEGAAVGEAMMTKPEEAARFVAESGVDMLAPAVGNIHGIIRGGDPALNAKRVKEISGAVKIPLVLHGASGNSASDIRKCIEAGVAIVHVNTELRVAFRSGLVKSLQENPEEIAAYKYLKPAKLAMQKIVEEKLRIISNRV
jgi:fructose-bisphosphate aldolase class II